MDYRKQFLVEPGSKVELSKIDTTYKDKHLSEEEALQETAKHCDRLRKLQYLLYSEKKHALLIVLQALDAAGKDGTVNHVMAAMNPQGTFVTGFKGPTALELEHDFLWRIHPSAPARGTVAIFNRSHYEDVLVVRVHNLVPEKVWSERYDQINDFERMLSDNGVQIVKFLLYISKDEQEKRFRERIDDKQKNWKFSPSDLKEREYWDQYIEAYEEMLRKCSKKHAPWYVIPANSKWFRNLAVSQILADTLEGMDLKFPKAVADLSKIKLK